MYNLINRQITTMKYILLTLSLILLSISLSAQTITEGSTYAEFNYPNGSKCYVSGCFEWYPYSDRVVISASSGNYKIMPGVFEGLDTVDDIKAFVDDLNARLCATGGDGGNGGGGEIDPGDILWTDIDTTGIKDFVLDCVPEGGGNGTDNHISDISSQIGEGGLVVTVTDTEGNTYTETIVIPWDSNGIDTTGMKAWLLDCLPPGGGGSGAEDGLTINGSNGNIIYDDGDAGTDDTIDLDLSTDSVFVDGVYAGQQVTILVNGIVAGFDTIPPGGGGGAFGCADLDGCITTNLLVNSQGLDSIEVLVNGVLLETFNDTNLPSTSIEPYLDENLDTIFAKGTFVHNDGTTDCIKLCDCPYTIQVDDQVGDLITSCGWHTVDLSLGDQPCLNTFGDTLLTIYSIESSNVVASIDPLTGIATYSLDLNEDGECADFTDDVDITYTASCADGTSSTGTYTAPVDLPCNSCISYFTSDNNTKRNLNYLTQTSGLAPNVGGIDGYSAVAHVEHLFFNHQVPNGSGTPERNVHWKVMEVGLDCTPIVCDIEATAPLFVNDGTANAGVPAAANKWVQWGDYVELVIQTEYNINIDFTTSQPFYAIPNDGENRIDGFFAYTSNCDDCGIEYIKIGRYNPDGTPLLVDDGNGNLTQPFLIQKWIRSDLNVSCDIVPSQNVECN